MSKYKTAREEFDALDSIRACALSRKREHSSLTIASLLPPQGKAMGSPLDVPYSSIPAEGINALASRIMSVVFPLTGQSVFELIMQRGFAPEGEDTSDLSAVFRRFEVQVMDTIAPTNLRAAIVMAYRHLLTIGDVMVYMDDELNFRLFRFDQYVVKRKHEGEWQEIIIREYVDPDFHPELSKEGTAIQTGSIQNFGEDQNWEPLHTRITRTEDGGVDIVQEWRDANVAEPVHEAVSPYMPLRWQAIVGEPYGTSLTEDSFGDIRALDSLSKALIDGAVLNAEYRWGINPAGLTEMQDMLDSMNGDFVATAPGDVFPIQFQNAAQVQMTQVAVGHREQVVGRRYLMNSAVQPQGERVTARQVSILAQELEGQLGGTLSQAAREVQEPILKRVIHVMEKKNLLPKEITEQIKKADGVLNLRMRAGLEILNREAEREKLDAAIERMRNLPEEALKAFIWPAIAKDWWESMGLESKGRVKDATQLEQERQAEMQAAQAAQMQANAQQMAMAAAQQPQQEQVSA